MKELINKNKKIGMTLSVDHPILRSPESLWALPDKLREFFS
jgi:hypothetical protein